MAVTEGPIGNIKGSTQAAGEKTPQHVLVVDATGSAVTFGGSGGTSSTDRGAFTAGTTLGTPAMGVYESSPTTLTTGQQGLIGLTANREVKVSVTSGGTSGTEYTEGDIDTSFTGGVMLTEGPSNTATPVQSNAAKDVLVAVNAALPAGTNAIGKLASNAGVTIGAVELVAAQTLATVTTVTTLTGTTSLTPGTAAANLGKAEDAAHASGDVGVMMLAVRTDTPAALAGTTGDYAPLQLDAVGAARVSSPRSIAASTAAQTTQSTTAASVLASNTSRKHVTIQNTGTTILKFNLGGSDPTATAYHFALSAGTAADDGTGGSWSSDVWTGEIRALSSGVGGTCVITELT